MTHWGLDKETAEEEPGRLKGPHVAEKTLAAAPAAPPADAETGRR